MNPFLLLTILGGTAYVVPKIFGSKRATRRVRRAARKNPLCGAWWSFGQAIQAFKTKTGWAFQIYDAAGRLDKDAAQESGADRFQSEADAVDYAMGITEANALQGASATLGTPTSFLDPTWNLNYFGEPVRPHIRVFTPLGMAARLPPEVDAFYCKNPDTNKIWVDETCNVVVEGAGYEPYSQGMKTLGEIEAPTIEEVLAIQGNSIYGYLGPFVDNAIDDAYNIAELVAEDLGCGRGDDGYLTVFQDAYIQDFARRISPWVLEAGGIPFAPP